MGAEITIFVYQIHIEGPIRYRHMELVLKLFNLFGGILSLSAHYDYEILR